MIEPTANPVSIRDGAALRRAARADVDALVALCRRAGRDVLRGQARDDVARRWWSVVLASRACEAWVVAAGDRLCGAMVVVRDDEAWRAEAAERDGAWPPRVLAAARHPWRLPVALVHARRREAREAAGEAVPRPDVPLLAVAPEHRASGALERLLAHADRRHPLAAVATERTVARLEVTTVETIADLPALAESWRAIRAAHGRSTPNADPVIFTATAAAFGAKATPHVSLLGDPDAPRALVVARRSCRAVRCRLGYASVRSSTLRCLDVVYGGLVTDGSVAAVEAVRDHLAGLLDRDEVDHIMINHLPVAHEVRAALTSPRAFPFAAVRGVPRAHRALDLAPGPIDETLARFSRKHRYNIRRQDRLLVEHFGGDVTLERVTAADELDAFADVATRITAAGYQGALTGGFDPTGVQRRVLRRAAEAGALRSYVLRAGGTPVAYQCGLVLDDVYHLRSTAFMPEHAALSPGQVLLVRVLTDLATDGIARVDYGFGEARYKAVYGNVAWDESTIHLYADNLRAATAHALDATCGTATRCAGWLAARAGVADRVKKRWRARLARRQGGVA